MAGDQMDGTQIYETFLAGKPQALHVMMDDISGVVDDMSSDLGDIGQVRSGIGEAYQGKGSDAMQSATDPLTQAHEESATHVAETGQVTGQQGDSFGTTRSQLKPVPAKPDAPSPLTAGADEVVSAFGGGHPLTQSYRDGMKKSADANDANVRAYQQYHQSTTQAAGALPTDYGKMEIRHGSLDMSIAPKQAVGVGQDHSSDGGASVGSTSAASAGPAATSAGTTSGAPVSSPTSVPSGGASGGGGSSYSGVTPVGGAGGSFGSPGGGSAGGGFTPTNVPNTPGTPSTPGAPVTGGSLPGGGTSGVGRIGGNIGSTPLSPSTSAASGAANSALAAEEAAMGAGTGGVPSGGGSINRTTPSPFGNKAGAKLTEQPPQEKVPPEKAASRLNAPPEEESAGKGAAPKGGSSGVGERVSQKYTGERPLGGKPTGTGGAAGPGAGGKKKDDDKEHEDKVGLKEEMSDGLDVEVDEMGVRTKDERGFTVTPSVIGDVNQE